MNTQQTIAKNATKTYFELGAQKLKALCDVMGFEDKTEQTLELFRYMISPWGETVMGESPSNPTRLTADSTPFHFSIAFCGQRAELRTAFEPVGADGTLKSQKEAAYPQIERFARDYNLSLDRFRQIEDLFLPEDPKGHFGIELGGVLGPSRIGEPDFQIYLHCFAQGEEKASALVEEAFRRLGFHRAWPSIAEVMERRGPDTASLRLFTLDLAEDQIARVKLYMRHFGATIQDIEAALSIAAKYVPGDATELCQAIIGNPELLINDYLITTYAFVEGDDERPSGATFGIWPDLYLPNDQVIGDRIYNYLAKHNLPCDLYNRCLKAIANRPLEEGVGLQHYISIKRERGEPRVTVYFSPEGFQVCPPKPLTTV